MSELTPMLKQYMEIKENTNDALVFYRLGDFYELFFDDALTAARVLDLVLTQRSAGNNKKAPMCGVPHHAAKSYIQKLVSNGYKVAIVEQVEDPKTAVGIVKREVVEIVTPGTYYDLDELETREIASVHADLVYASIVSCDLVSGSLKGIRVMNDPIEIMKNLQQLQVKEVVFDSSFNPKTIKEISDKSDIYISYQDDLDQSITHADQGFEMALKRLMGYLSYTHKRKLDHLGVLQILNDESYLRMDYNSMNNLELFEHQKSKDLSLFHFLNHTYTTMGARQLRTWLMRPLVTQAQISTRHSRMEVLMHDFNLNEDLVDEIKNTYDIHRVVARMAALKHNPQDFVRLKQTLYAFKQIQSLLGNSEEFDFISKMDNLSFLADNLEETVFDDAPVIMKEGRTFKPGLNEKLDELMNLKSNGKQWLLDYEQSLKEKTGIKNLKLGYNRAFGYYIEVSKGQVENVKEEHGFIRKQTLTSAERYINQDLQEYEVKSLSASDKIIVLENQLFDELSSYVSKYSNQIHAIGEAISILDSLLSLAHVSLLPGFTKPSFNNNQTLNIVNGRHPVLEATLKNQQYVASDVDISDEKNCLILTGPNMGGKSTYMRMIALNVIMAQLGTYIPCDSADIAIVDQIFTRMGASDDILMGQSTFMVEMLEAQTALGNATKQSLVLFDEIGRGTSTYDGMALAQAILEYMQAAIGCMAVFSTHYHELVALENMVDGIKNVHVEVHEENDDVTFLYKVVSGHAKQSYGINVARLAHLPHSLIQRAKENLLALEMSQKDISIENKVITIEMESQSFSEMKRRLKDLNIDQITPLESLMLLAEFKKMLGDDQDE